MAYPSGGSCSRVTRQLSRRRRCSCSRSSTSTDPPAGPRAFGRVVDLLSMGIRERVQPQNVWLAVPAGLRVICSRRARWCGSAVPYAFDLIVWPMPCIGAGVDRIEPLSRRCISELFRRHALARPPSRMAPTHPGLPLPAVVCPWAEGVPGELVELLRLCRGGRGDRPQSQHCGAGGDGGQERHAPLPRPSARGALGQDRGEHWPVRCAMADARGRCTRFRAVSLVSRFEVFRFVMELGGAGDLAASCWSSTSTRSSDGGLRARCAGDRRAAARWAHARVCSADGGRSDHAEAAVDLSGRSSCRPTMSRRT